MLKKLRIAAGLALLASLTVNAQTMNFPDPTTTDGIIAKGECPAGSSMVLMDYLADMDRPDIVYKMRPDPVVRCLPSGDLALQVGDHVVLGRDANKVFRVLSRK